MSALSEFAPGEGSKRRRAIALGPPELARADIDFRGPQSGTESQKTEPNARIWGSITDYSFLEAQF